MFEQAVGPARLYRLLAFERFANKTRFNVLKRYCLPILSALVALGVTVNPAVGQTQSQKGAVMGGVAGAILGGIAGHQNDETPEGIAIGGVAGAIAGGLLGKAQDNQLNRQRYEFQQAQQVQQQYQVSRAVSISDAIAMSRSGLSPNLIVSQIRSSGVQQEIGVQEVILLHENGVSELVIQEMQRAQLGAPSPVVVQRAPAVIYQQRPQVIVEHYPVYQEPVYHYVPAYQAYGHYHGYHR